MNGENRPDGPQSVPPLFGLVLAGGYSSRMGSDKAALRIHGEPQVRRQYRMLSRHCRQVFVSIRPEQRNEPVFAGLPLIEDRYRDIGPLAGLLSAFDTDPEAAWFVAAVDMPDAAEAGERLAAHRHPDRAATAPIDPASGVLQPLFTIYEPSAHAPLRAALRAGRHGLRRLLEELPVRRLTNTGAASFRDIDTAEEMHAHVREEKSWKELS